jgi:hypothetical protein
MLLQANFPSSVVFSAADPTGVFSSTLEGGACVVDGDRTVVAGDAEVAHRLARAAGHHFDAAIGEHPFWMWAASI